MNSLDQVRTLWVLMALSFNLHVRATKISPDGGYTDVVVRVQDDVPENQCPQILENFKV
jgi:hypothetical protein